MVLTRRTFLKATAGVVGGCAVLGGGGYLLADSMGSPLVIKKNTTLDFEMDETLKEALYAASLAPSSHNIQNWSVGVSSQRNELCIYRDTKRTLDVIDPDCREATIAVGAFTQNLTEALNAYGYRPDVVLNAEKGAALCATITYEKRPYSSLAQGALDVFAQRHSDKRVYQKDTLPADVLTNLLRKQGSTVSYHPANEASGAALADITMRAFVQQAGDQMARDELADWLRFSDAEALALRDGLPAEQLGLTGFMKTLYYLTTNRESARGDSFAQQGIDKAKGQLKGCAGFFTISGGEGKKAWLETGMLLEAFWLDATRERIALHPMSAALQERNYREELGSILQSKESIHMILRAGLVSDYGSNNGIRRNIGEFVFTGD